MSTQVKNPNEHAIANARGWAESIAEDIAALHFAQEGQDPCEKCDGEGHAEDAKADEDGDFPPCAACDGEGSIDPDDRKAEEIRERITEGPLSVEVRSGWYAPGTEASPPEEFCILLSTGGPALRIMGDLDEHGQPTRAYLQWQDWGTSWTNIFDVPVEPDTLVEYASNFLGY